MRTNLSSAIFLIPGFVVSLIMATLTTLLGIILFGRWSDGDRNTKTVLEAMGYRIAHASLSTGAKVGIIVSGIGVFVLYMALFGFIIYMIKK